MRILCFYKTKTVICSVYLIFSSFLCGCSTVMYGAAWACSIGTRSEVVDSTEFLEAYDYWSTFAFISMPTEYVYFGRKGNYYRMLELVQKKSRFWGDRYVLNRWLKLPKFQGDKLGLQVESTIARPPTYDARNLPLAAKTWDEMKKGKKWSEISKAYGRPSPYKVQTHSSFAKRLRPKKA